MSCDLQGRSYATFLDAGDIIEVDAGFDCAQEGEQFVVMRDNDDLYFRCAAASGRHLLEGQWDDERGCYIGIYHVKET